MIVGVRPEHFQRSGQGSGLTGPVTIVEPTGGQTFVTVDLGGQPTVVTISGDDLVAVEQGLTLYTSPEQVYVFHASTGVRLSDN